MCTDVKFVSVLRTLLSESTVEKRVVVFFLISCVATVEFVYYNLLISDVTK